MASATEPAEGDDTPVVVHYFIDEAGTPTLFGHRGKIMVGQEGCSQFFLLGKLEVGDPTALATALHQLRQELLADPFFKSAPSMLPDAGKTAVIFHAKDDLPEARYRVFQLLMRQEVRFSAVVRASTRKERTVSGRLSGQRCMRCTMWTMPASTLSAQSTPRKSR